MRSWVTICHACEHRQRECTGSCACTRDGRDIIEHAGAMDCPEGRFTEARLTELSREPTTAPAAEMAGPCLHRGDVVDLVRCPSCVGVVMLKVHRCGIHGRCTLAAAALDGVKACATCGDRMPIEDGSLGG